MTAFCFSQQDTFLYIMTTTKEVLFLSPVWLLAEYLKTNLTSTLNKWLVFGVVTATTYEKLHFLPLTLQLWGTEENIFFSAYFISSLIFQAICIYT